MKFSTGIYSFSKPEVSENNKIVYLALGILGIALLGLDQEILPNNFLIRSTASSS